VGGMGSWRMKIEGTVREWFLTPSGEYIGMIAGDDGGVYVAGSKDCVHRADVPQITVGTRVRFTDEKHGSGTDMDTKKNYPWGVAREIALPP
jgi:hypothetical protein